MNDATRLEPLSYHREIRDYLKERERELWEWFASARAKENYAEELRLGLLKSTYRLTPADHPELYSYASAALGGLALEVPVTLYQSQGSSQGANASIFYLPGEAHIVLSGPIITLLNPAELTSVFGHELAHFLLWRSESEEFLIADRLLQIVSSDNRAQPAHIETARRYRLYTEIFADRGAAQVTNDLPAVVAALVKIHTGLATVNGSSYLTQAAEIFSKSAVKTAELSHPEAFIRAHALALWTAQGTGANGAIRTMIAGKPTLDELDIVGQTELARLSQRFLAQLLRPRWFRSDPILAQARLYFPDFAPAESEDPGLLNVLQETGSMLKEYFSYLLLDFVHVDRDLEEVPLAAAIRWAENLGIAGHFEKLAAKELGIKARDLSRLKPRIAELLATAERSV